MSTARNEDRMLPVPARKICAVVPAPQKVVSDRARTKLNKKATRRLPIHELAIGPGDAQQRAFYRVPKSLQTKEMLIASFRNHYLLRFLTLHEMTEMINVMTLVIVQAGDTIITQGAPENCFYVLESGQCDILINDKVVGRYKNKDAFGELAFLYNCPPPATIRALNLCILWSVHRDLFRQTMASIAAASQIARLGFLKNVELFQNFCIEELEKIAAALQLEAFDDGDTIVRQGEPGNVFYIIRSGSVRVASADKELSVLVRGDYFGEMALMLNEPRQANCIAMGKVECYSLDRSLFVKLLGPLRALLDRQMRIRVLRGVYILASLSDDELDQLAHCLNVVCFENQTLIIAEGDSADTFFMISNGTVSVRKNGVEMMQLHTGEFFGERALLHQAPRAADCIAIGQVECLTLHRDVFAKFVNKLVEKMQSEKERQEKLEKRVLKKLKTPLFRIEDFEKARTIGTGTFGRVYLVRHRITAQVFALKCMQKVNIIESHQEMNVMYEKKIVSECDHPFILKLIRTFSDTNQLYMLFELVQGGELWSLLYQKSVTALLKGPNGAFRVSSARFYAACVAEALSYLQTQNVAYRDLKPENLVLDREGYIKMVDFGFAKHIPYWKEGTYHDRSFTLCGTPEYLAPELVLNKGHGKAIDHWAFGCLLYELLVGCTPFTHDDPNRIFERIVMGRKDVHFPFGFDEDAKDLVMKLLEPNPVLRIGSLANGLQDVMDHPFFRKINWDDLRAKKLKAPHVPAVRHEMDANNFELYSEDEVVMAYHGANDVFEDF